MDFKLSIIIPVLNDVDELQKLIPHLIEHGSDHEIWVIEASKSVNKSKELCSKYGVNYIDSNTYGRAKQMNIGAKHALGNVFLFLHADVIPPSTFVFDIKANIANGNKMGYFAYKFSPSNKLLDINASFTEKEGIFTGGGDQCHFITKEAFEKLGGYDESYVIMEDFALIRKAKKFKIPLSIIQNKAIVSSRKYENNSYLWVNFVNLVVFSAFYIGISPKVLKTVYTKALN